jgi:glycosyltransferase involved in cell wall biosynthesis
MPDQPLKILHCISTFATGGAERQLSLLAPQQARLGDEVDVVFLGEGPNLRPIVESGVPTHRIAAHTYRDPRLLLGLERVMSRVRPDIVHTWLLQMDVAAGAVALRRGIPWVLAERSCRAAYEPLSVRRRLRFAMGKFADGVIANSEAGQSMWAGYLRSQFDAYFVPNAVAVDEILTEPATSRSDLRVEGTRPIVLVAGRLALEKNVLFLVEVAETVCARSNAVFLVCGEGPLESEISAAVTQRRLSDGFRLLGNRTDVWGIMKTADLFVNASLFEGQPNAVLEAVVCRCPLVVSDIPAHRRLLPPTSARFANLGSSADFATAILEVLDSPENARNMSKSAAESVPVPTPGSVALRHRAIYQQLLSRS